MLRVWPTHLTSCKCIIRFVIWGRNILYFLFDSLLWSSSDSTVYYFPGMNEALEHLDRLNEYNFHIPEDLAIRHLTKINDAFGDTWLLTECKWISSLDLRMEKNIKRQFSLRTLGTFDWENWWAYVVVLFWDPVYFICYQTNLLWNPGWKYCFSWDNNSMYIFILQYRNLLLYVLPFYVCFVHDYCLWFNATIFLYFRSPKNGAFIQQKIIVMNNYPFVSKKTVGKLKDAQINNYN